MTSANQLVETLAALRRQWRMRVILESVVWIAIAAVIAIAAGLLITAMFGTTSTTVLFMRGLGYALIIAAVVRYLVRPLIRRASDERFALYVEERAPELRQLLLSAVHELKAPESERGSPSLTARLMERTLTVVRPIEQGRTIERPRVVRALRALGGMAVAAALLFAIGPKGLRSTTRQIFAPWSIAEAATPTLAVRVRPGNAAIPRGAAVDVSASLAGFSADGAELVFRTDSATEWVRMPMARDSVDGSFTSRVFDLTKRTEYYVDANGIRSPTYALSVTDLPAMSAMAIDLRYPAYTGLPAEHFKEGGDVAAVVGSQVTIHATITKPVKGGTLAFDNGTKVPFTIGADGTLTATFPVKTTGFYRVDLVAPDGANVPGAVQYAVEALPDRPPTVRIAEPGRDTKVTSVEEVTVAVAASDDYGVESLELRYRVNGGDEKTLALTDSGRHRSTEPRAAHTFFLEELKLVPGDLITYHAVAKDGAGNVGVSDVYFLEIRPLGKNYRQAEQQGGGGGGGGGGDSPDGFVARQREVVAGTFNWIRDSTNVPVRKHKEDVATLNIAEGRLRTEVVALAQKMTERAAARTDTTFALIQAELVEASKHLQAAEERLVKAQGKEALPVEQVALQHLQRAEELYRNVQVQMGGQQGGGGGGGGGQKKAEELADLFELQTDKLNNQYEAVQQQSQQQQQSREVDATLERLKQLANRQQQENERMQKMAEAMREKLGKEQGGGGGGGGSQRELAKQAEEEARRLERLAREQKSPQMAEAAQQMQQAADAMKRASTGSAAQGAAAMEQLNRAANGLENARSAAATDAVRKLAEQAKELQDQQQSIAEGVKQLATTAPEKRGEQIQQLNQQKDALSKGVQKLENDADRAAREARREQPAAAGKLGDVGNAIRDQRIREKVDFSKNVIRGGSSEYANTFEGQIGENLKDVADRAKAATGALSGQSASRNQEKTLDQARELVRSMESLRQRVGDKTGMNGQQLAQGQQGKGQQGQGQQGQGQQGQGQQGQGQQGQGQQGKGQQGKGQQGQGQQGQGLQGQGQQGQGQKAQGQGGQQGQGQQGQGQQGQGQGGQQGQGQQGGQSQQGGGGGGQQDGQNPSGGGGSGGSPRNGQMRGGTPGSRSGVDPSDARQFAREFAMRRQSAEELRKELAKQGVATNELDRAIDEMRRLEGSMANGDPKGIDELQKSVIDGLKTFEFTLYRKLGLGDSKAPTLGTNAPVPAEYRAAVEEYYRSLAGARRQPE